MHSILHVASASRLTKCSYFTANQKDALVHQAVNVSRVSLVNPDVVSVVKLSIIQFMLKETPKMATGGAPTRKEEDFRHTCSLCMEPYRGRSPKILPCFHTFCLPCLTALQDSVTIATPKRRPEQEKRPTEDEDHKQPDSNSDQGKTQDKTSEGSDVTKDRSDDVEKSVFLCPSCRAPVSIPEGGVAALQVRCLVY